MYPCNDNELLNFVCIHPDSESHATPTDGRFCSVVIRMRVFRSVTDTAQSGPNKATYRSFSKSSKTLIRLYSP